MLVKPGNSLQESLLLGVLFDLLGEIAADSKPMRNTTVEVDLIRVARFFQDNLGTVTLLPWEDAISLGGRNGKRCLEPRQLLFLDERRVCHEADIDSGLVVADNVLHSARHMLDIPYGMILLVTYLLTLAPKQ